MVIFHRLLRSRLGNITLFHNDLLSHTRQQAVNRPIFSRLLMLEPLSPGPHVINFGGSVGDFSQEITYTLFVN